MFDLDFNLKGRLELHTRKFLLYPNFWKDDENLINGELEWRQIKFTDENIQEVPDAKGIYCFIVKPMIPNFFETSYLFYVGETKRTLKIRYREYLRDQKGEGKPRNKVFEMLNLYRDYLYFYYAEMTNDDLININEDKLLNTFVPAINSKIPKAQIMPELQNIYE